MANGYKLDSCSEFTLVTINRFLHNLVMVDADNMNFVADCNGTEVNMFK